MRSVLPPLAVPTQTILILCCTVNPLPLPSHPSHIRPSFPPHPSPSSPESDVPSKFGFPISSIFLGSYLSIQWCGDDGEGYIRTDSANFPISTLDRLLFQASKQVNERDTTRYRGELGTQISVYEFWKRNSGKMVVNMFPYPSVYRVSRFSLLELHRTRVQGSRLLVNRLNKSGLPFEGGGGIPWEAKRSENIYTYIYI